MSAVLFYKTSNFEIFQVSNITTPMIAAEKNHNNDIVYFIYTPRQIIVDLFCVCLFFLFFSFSFPANYLCFYWIEIVPKLSAKSCFRKSTGANDKYVLIQLV